MVDEVLEKYWSILPIADRLTLLKDLGVSGENREYLGGRTIDQIVETDQADLPGIIKGRLVCALTVDGFSKEEYLRVKEETEKDRSRLHELGIRLTSCVLERGN